jgi:threonine aldolase
MLEAIKNAKLGDDVYKEDPTVNQLEETAAKMMGKEAALLMPSGTMANLASIKTNTKWGDSIILEEDSHIYWYELGGISAIAGTLPIAIKGKMGYMDPKDIESSIRAKDLHTAETTLVCIENTHNRAGGTIVTPTQIKNISQITKEYGLKLYMDGARIFNAAVALKVDVRELTRFVDNLMFCLSKGLSCPIGSIIVGTDEFINTAKKTRKILGGGMRQAGIIAAPGIIALEKMVDRLENDHKNAYFLAKGLAEIEGIDINLDLVQTNIVMCEIDGLGVDADIFICKLKEHGVLALSLRENGIRTVTHRGIEKKDIEKTIHVFRDVTKEILKK